MSAAERDAQQALASAKGPNAWAISLFTASLSLAGVGISLYVNGRQQQSLEEQKFAWQKQIESDKMAQERAKVFLGATVELSNRIASAEYEVGSFLESAYLYPAQTDKLYAAHEARMKELMPPVVAAHAAVGAHNMTAFAAFGPIIKEISTLDQCVTVIVARMGGDKRAFALKGLFTSQQIVLRELARRVNSIATGATSTGWFSVPCEPPAE